MQNRSGKIKDDVMHLLRDYDGLLHEANGIYMTQRLDSGPQGLDDFYRLIQIIKRNRDVIGSVARGIDNVRSTDKFKFIEEDAENLSERKREPPKSSTRVKKPKPSPVLSGGSEASPLIEDIEVQQTAQPEVNNG